MHTCAYTLDGDVHRYIICHRAYSKSIWLIWKMRLSSLCEDLCCSEGVGSVGSLHAQPSSIRKNQKMHAFARAAAVREGRTHTHTYTCTAQHSTWSYYRFALPLMMTCDSASQIATFDTRISRNCLWFRVVFRSHLGRLLSV